MGGLLLGLALAGGGVGAADPPPSGTAAAERTRAKLLTAKVSGDFKSVALREVLKEFAHQVEEAGRPVMWTYAPGVKASDPVTYTCKDKPLSAALKDLCDAAELAFVVLSEDDQPRDGWVWVAPPDEAKAYKLFDEARGLLKEKPADARLLLGLVGTKYPGTKSAGRAADLLKELSK